MLYYQVIVEEKKVPFSFLDFFCYAIASATIEWFCAICLWTVYILSLNENFVIFGYQLINFCIFLNIWVFLFFPLTCTCSMHIRWCCSFVGFFFKCLNEGFCVIWIKTWLLYTSGMDVMYCVSIDSSFLLSYVPG